MSTSATILDMCCGSRMLWFDKNDEWSIFSDIRKEEHSLCDGRHPIIIPTLSLIFVRCRGCLLCIKSRHYQI